jgi:predicted sugar kinase
MDIAGAIRDIGAGVGRVSPVQNVGFKKVGPGLQPPQVAGLPDVLRTSGAPGGGLSSFGPAVLLPGMRTSRDSGRQRSHS